MRSARVETPLIHLQARLEELIFIDEAVCNYIQLLHVVVQPSMERDEVVAQLHAFRQRYEIVFARARCAHRACGGRRVNTEAGEQQLVSWRATGFELIAFDCAVIAYLRLLEMAQISEKRRQRALKHLATFHKRYIRTLGALPLV